MQFLAIVASPSIFFMFCFLSFLFEFSLAQVTDRSLQLLGRPRLYVDPAKATRVCPALLWLLNTFSE